MENERRRFLKLLASLGVTSLFPGCVLDLGREESQTQSEPQFSTNFRDILLKENIEGPSGLSSSKKIQVFVEKPTFNPIQTLDNPFPEYFTFRTKPKIHKVNLADLTTHAPNIPTQVLYEFPDDKDTADEFADGILVYFDENGNLFHRPRVLSTNTAVSEDGSILFSFSNVRYKKIYRIFPNQDGTYDREVFMENDELVGIMDIMLGNNRKLYATQMTIWGFGEPAIRRKKRVISIDPTTKEMTVEFEMPTTKESTGLYSIINNIKYEDCKVQYREQVHIVENTLEGRLKNEIGFYVADLLEGVIYKVSRNKVSVFKELHDSPPLSLEIDTRGNLYVITAPILNQDKTLYRPSSLLKIRPDGQLSKELEFNQRDLDLRNDLTFDSPIILDDQTYKIPSVYTISTNLHETPTDWGLYYTDSHRGQWRVIRHKSQNN